ncbi:PTS sugar transporter subunit IIB [Rhodococcus sp. IEGM 1409]|uniref:PTS sugar transporter subunit IIB n=1 Tax=Rhodococcus sp. IEGM 1409 TaxID=3047082 RepID=UPI0024B80C3A|nr:PTS sugar transporter subunit IIB [Rhodococcus sp. IEGM 1409]MDI9903169.1 PTS sugar transporter subunit IIB [Rhodococcus sp. IEGM 1409]
MTINRTLQVLTVCGVGMGSSLILKMTAEDALKTINLDSRVENTDICSARGLNPDVIVGQGMHTADISDLAPIVISVSDFLDVDGLRAQLVDELGQKGWL